MTACVTCQSPDSSCMCWLDDPVTPELVTVPNDLIALIFTQGWPMTRLSSGYQSPPWVIVAAQTAKWALGVHPFGDVKSFCAKVRDVKSHGFVRAEVARGLCHSGLFAAVQERTNT